jgi:repressor LexA
MKLTENQSGLLKFLRKHSGLNGRSLGQVAEAIGAKSPQAVFNALRRLIDLGLVRQSGAGGSYEVLRHPVEAVAYVRLLGTATCGNEDEFFSDENVRDEVAVPTALLNIANPDDYFLAKARGDSMAPRIASGDLVLFRRQDTVDDRGVALVIHEGAAKIKQVIRHRDSCTLASTNPVHPPVHVHDPEDLRVLGIARAVLGKFTSHA